MKTTTKIVFAFIIGMATMVTYSVGAMKLVSFTGTQFNQPTALQQAEGLQGAVDPSIAPSIQIGKGTANASIVPSIQVTKSAEEIRLENIEARLSILESKIK